VKVREFAVEWREWWNNIQPSWRSGGSGPLHGDCPPDADWKVLHRGGSNGIFIVVMCLSWWGKFVTSPTDRELFDAAVEEVALVFENVSTSIHVSAGTKRAADHSDTGSTNKRARK
jgi:hypothetical protein